jgi:hypothetical protein
MDPERTEPERQDLLTILTTEHFTLQGARAQTVAESTARATLYVGAVSSALVALGFIGQMSKLGDEFDLFALAVLPTLYFLGLFTFVRLVETGLEDIVYGRAINRIRHFYREVASARSDLFLLSGHDDAAGVLANMGLRRLGRWQLAFTAASAIAVVNSVVAGSAVGMLLSALFDTPLAVAAGAAIIAAVMSAGLQLRWQQRRYVERDAEDEPLFPTPPQ